MHRALFLSALMAFFLLVPPMARADFHEIPRVNKSDELPVPCPQIISKLCFVVERITETGVYSNDPKRRPSEEELSVLTMTALIEAYTEIGGDMETVAFDSLSFDKNGEGLCPSALQEVCYFFYAIIAHTESSGAEELLLTLPELGELVAQVTVDLYRRNVDEYATIKEVPLCEEKNPNNILFFGVQEDSRIAHITIPSFFCIDQSRFKIAIRYLVENGSRAHIIDLRHNPGGANDDAAYLFGLYFGGNRHFMTVLLPDGSREEQFSPREIDRIVPEGTPIIIYVGPDTTSAAELFAAAMRNAGKQNVILLGEKTYGKNIVQRVFYSRTTPFLLSEGEILSAEGEYGEGIFPNQNIPAHMDSVLGTKADQIIRQLLKRAQ